MENIFADKLPINAPKRTSKRPKNVKSSIYFQIKKGII